MGLYIFVFGMKLLEVTIFSLRTVLITSGEKKLSSIMGFFEVIVWGFGTGIVVSFIFEDLFILIPFLLGGQIGIYMGMSLQSYVSKRDTIIISYIREEKLEKTMEDLKETNYGLTVLESEEEKKVLLIATKRNRISKLKRLIKSIDKESLIITSPAYDTIGGHIY
jgi:uncharacterized protein YebE (UPF0316 family)